VSPWLRDPIIHFDIMTEAFKGRGVPPQPDLRNAAEQSSFYFSTAGPSPLVPSCCSFPLSSTCPLARSESVYPYTLAASSFLASSSFPFQID